MGITFISALFVYVVRLRRQVCLPLCAYAVTGTMWAPTLLAARCYADTSVKKGRETLGRKLGYQESLCYRRGRNLCSWLGGVRKTMKVEDREKIKEWDGEVAEGEGWIFWAHWRVVLREIMRIWSQHFQVNFGNSCVGRILMQPESLNISNNRAGITNDGKQGECRQCSLLGRGLGLGSVWLSCHDSSSCHDPYCHRRSISRHEDASEEQKAEGAWDEGLFLSICRPERTCLGQVPHTVPSHCGVGSFDGELRDTLVWKDWQERDGKEES